MIVLVVIFIEEGSKMVWSVVVCKCIIEVIDDWFSNIDCVDFCVWVCDSREFCDWDVDGFR